MLTMPSTEASVCSLTTHPTANTINPVTRVNTARLFSRGCRSPSLFSDRGERGRVLAASGISATLLSDPRLVGEDSSRAAPWRTLRREADGAKWPAPATGIGNEPQAVA